MSDAMDAVAEAMARTKQLAARHLMRKQELEGEIARLRLDRAGIEDAALAQEVDARLAAAATELAAATQDYQSALGEIAELKRLAGQARQAEARAVVAQATGGDPLIRSAEEVALDNVRERVADLDAQARLSDELGERPAGRSSPPAAPPPAPERPSREEAEATARSEFEALRAKRQSPGGDPSSTGAGAPPRPPKKTM